MKGPSGVQLLGNLARHIMNVMGKRLSVDANETSY